MRGYKVEGIIIKRRDQGEADRIITLFSRSKGKISLKAKGVRQSNSRRAGSLELFNRVKAGVARGHSDLDILTEVEVLDAYSSWRKFLGRIVIAYQLCETIDKLTPDRQPHPGIFELLESFLSQISSLSDDWQETVDSWLTRIVIGLGFLDPGIKPEMNIKDYIEQLSERPINSVKLLKKLSPRQ